MSKSIIYFVFSFVLLPACESSPNANGSDQSGQGDASGVGGMAQSGDDGISGSGIAGTGGEFGSGGTGGGGGSSPQTAGSGESGSELMDGATGDGAVGETAGDAAADAADAANLVDGYAQTGQITLFPVNGSFDYQLGGAYTPPEGVNIVTRDRNDAPASGLYNICYINGLQTQPGEESQWDRDLILRDAGGSPVIDPDWNEMLLDVSTEDKRSRIAAVVGGWIEKCAADGFEAVEIDNLDSYSRSGGRITQDNAATFMALLAVVAHGKGLAIAQKNAAEIARRRCEMGTDFAVAEECSHWNECGDYVDMYGDYVLMIEYDDNDFTQGCSGYGATHAIVRRDLYLVTPGNPAYDFAGC
ncbi:MAG: endo alpha-1,4 polygalactosaminidase [Deltaproteobacteria bacterium]|nr:endo alpha-1,4 polygalactosaminidase [Deltaproteobacteria bacterium]